MSGASTRPARHVRSVGRTLATAGLLGLAVARWMAPEAGAGGGVRFAVAYASAGLLGIGLFVLLVARVSREIGLPATFR